MNTSLRQIALDQVSGNPTALSAVQAFIAAGGIFDVRTGANSSYHAGKITFSQNDLDTSSAAGQQRFRFVLMHEIGHWATQRAGGLEWATARQRPETVVEWYYRHEARTMMYGFFTDTMFGYSDPSYPSTVVQPIYDQLRPMFDSHDISWSALESTFSNRIIDEMVTDPLHRAGAMTLLNNALPSSIGGTVSYQRGSGSGFGFGWTVVYGAPQERGKPPVPPAPLRDDLPMLAVAPVAPADNSATANLLQAMAQFDAEGAAAASQYASAPRVDHHLALAVAI